MTTSGLATFNPAVQLIVAAALRALGIISEEEEPSGEQFATALYTLNTIVAALQATGAHVWTEEEAILFPQVGVAKYVIGGPTLSLNANTAPADAWLQLTLSANAAGGATTIAVQSAVGVLSGDNIGVILNNGLTFWTTVNGAPVGSVVTLDSALPSVGASSGAFALDYVTPIVRPLKVPGARLRYLGGNGYPNNPNETPMTIMSRQEYMDLPNKLSPGTPTQWFYSPKRDHGDFYIWPVPVTTDWAIRFTWYRPLQDFFLPTDTMDFPQEWIAPLQWALALDLIGDYDVPPPRQQYIQQQAAKYADLVVNYDRESEPVQFGLSWESVNND